MEDGPSAPEANVGFTAFNMKEELEEGHFDKEGHYLWKKEKQIRDNWLDNIDWIQVSKTNMIIMCIDIYNYKISYSILWYRLNQVPQLNKKIQNQVRYMG